uniref:Uncharacterized protein n=1 Tax=Cacopsylla melanoneura TaxID=428564 RepID=A0A8D9BGC0_9HEMI
MRESRTNSVALLELSTELLETVLKLDLLDTDRELLGIGDWTELDSRNTVLDSVMSLTESRSFFADAATPIDTATAASDDTSRRERSETVCDVPGGVRRETVGDVTGGVKGGNGVKADRKMSDSLAVITGRLKIADFPDLGL